jgi:hypothetical protein
VTDNVYDAQYHSAEPVDPDWQESPFSSGTFAQEQNPMLGEMPHHPLHVKVVDTQAQNVAAEFTAWSTQFPVVAGGGVATQLCPHRYHRLKAKFNWYIPPGITVWIANKPDPLSSPTPANSQYQLTSTNGDQPDYDGQQPMYAVYTGTVTTPSQPAVPASGTAVQNPNATPVQVVISGGTATQTFVNGVLVGGGDGTYIVPGYGSISVTYSVAPTWVWSNLTGTVTAPWCAIMDESYGTVQ